MEELGSYALALDGDGAALPGARLEPRPSAVRRACRAPERAERVTAPAARPRLQLRLGHPHAGRAARPRFNPMSYHNGSIWPHDTAICAAGMARYGERDGVVRLLSGMFEAAVHFDMRLPELFCGFARRAGEAPVAYPVACLPQAWASGSVFMLLQACLGLRVDGWRGEIHVDRPRLPIGIDRLTIRHLRGRRGAGRPHLPAHRRPGGRLPRGQRPEPRARALARMKPRRRDEGCATPGERYPVGRAIPDRVVVSAIPAPPRTKPVRVLEQFAPQLAVS